jgi:hypothetical protein
MSDESEVPFSLPFYAFLCALRVLRGESSGFDFLEAMRSGRGESVARRPLETVYRVSKRLRVCTTKGTKDTKERQQDEG